jgi:hypothetical protein
MRTRVASADLSPSCMAPKSPAEPGIAAPMKRSSPNTRCHFLMLTRLLWRRSSKMSVILALRRSVSSRVPLLVSRIHPNTSFRWFQPPSPLLSFFSDMASFRFGWASSGLVNTPSTACMMQRLTLWQRRRDPWATPMKSSTKTSTCATGPPSLKRGGRSWGGGRGAGRLAPSGGIGCPEDSGP